jgi:hypothetical protein
MEGQRIKITSCGVSNAYVKNDVVEYPKNPSYVIFGYELQSDSSSSGATVSAPAFEVDSEELPF